MAKSAKAVAGATPVDVELPDDPVLVKVPPPPKRTGMAAMYPDTAPLFYYEPENGGEKIPLPTQIVNPPDKKFFWEMHQVRGNAFSQMYMYMDRFEVPKMVQRHIVDNLSDSEFMTLCNKWFESMNGGTTAGE
jgi:hypothetical protein